MFTEHTVAYNLETTCRCCLRDLVRLASLNKPVENTHDSRSKVMVQRTIGDVLMEVVNIQVCSSVCIIFDRISCCDHFQFISGDGLPQKVCRKCIAALSTACAFRKMCLENDIKLREYFGRYSKNSVCADKVPSVDVGESEFASQIVIDPGPSDGQMVHQTMNPDVALSDGANETRPDKNLLDNAECEPSDPPNHKYKLATLSSS